jgi:hypothetical protein
MNLNFFAGFYRRRVVGNVNVAAFIFPLIKVGLSRSPANEKKCRKN